MRTETKIGVVAGFAVVVAASVYFWKSKSHDRDLIVALTPSVVQPTQVGGGARPAISPTHPAITTPTRTAGAPTQLGAAPPALARGETPKPPVSVPIGPPTPERLATAPGIIASNPTPPAFVPLRTGPSDSLRVAANGNAGSPIKTEPTKTIIPADAGKPVVSTPGVSPAAGETARIADSTSSGTVKLPPAIAQPPAPAVKPASGGEWKSTGAQASSGEWPKYHTVAKGETLAGIARKTYGDARRVDLILAANPEIKNPRQVRVGAKLTLPSAPDAVKPSEVAAAPAAVDSKPISLLAKSNTTAVDEKKETPADHSVPAGKTYKVQQGDSLYSIAVETLGDGRRWPELLKANKAVVGADGSKIRPGMVLSIPGGDAAAKPGSEQSAKR